MADVNVTNHGSVFLFHLNSEDARSWVEENVQEDAQYIGNALAVEPRYVEDLFDGMLGDGLEVE